MHTQQIRAEQSNALTVRDGRLEHLQQLRRHIRHHSLCLALRNDRLSGLGSALLALALDGQDLGRQRHRDFVMSDHSLQL